MKEGYRRPGVRVPSMTDRSCVRRQLNDWEEAPAAVHGPLGAPL